MTGQVRIAKPAAADDKVIGIPDLRTEIVLLRPPLGRAGVELASFVRHDHEPGSPTAMATELGLRSIRFEVGDLQGPSTAWLRTDTDWSAGSSAPEHVADGPCARSGRDPSR